MTGRRNSRTKASPAPVIDAQAIAAQVLTQLTPVIATTVAAVVAEIVGGPAPLNASDNPAHDDRVGGTQAKAQEMADTQKSPPKPITASKGTKRSDVDKQANGRKQCSADGCRKHRKGKGKYCPNHKRYSSASFRHMLATGDWFTWDAKHQVAWFAENGISI